MENVQERKRSFDINKLSQEQAQEISAQIGEKVRLICDEACEKANKILNIYGMKAIMQIAIMPEGEEVDKSTEPKTQKKRGRPKKAPNL